MTPQDAIDDVPDASATSPLMLSDRLLTLAREADRAGFLDTADRLVILAHDVFNERYPVHS